jgi:alcohol dehydrogenase
MLLQLMQAGKLAADALVTHRFGFDAVPAAYDLLDDPVGSGALKVAVLRT